MSIKRFTQGLTLTAGILALSSAESRAVTLDFSNLVSANISFNGAGGFVFDPDPDFSIDTVAGPLNGDISGAFTIGDITTVSGTSEATVGGAGVLSIFDGAATFTANVTWDVISQTGTGTFINVNGILNLTGASYLGTNPDLVALAAADGYAVVSFENGDRSLSQLKTESFTSGFSGTVGNDVPSNVPDGGATALLLGFGFLGLASAHRKFLK